MVMTKVEEGHDVVGLEVAEGAGGVDLAGRGGAPPYPEPMAELYGLERIASLAEDKMGGNVAIPAQPVKNVEHLPGRCAIQLDQAQDIGKPRSLIDRHASALGDPHRQALRELPGLDQGGVRIVDEVSLGEPSECRQAGIELLEVIEIARSFHAPCSAKRRDNRYRKIRQSGSTHRPGRSVPQVAHGKCADRRSPRNGILGTLGAGDTARAEFSAGFVSRRPAAPAWRRWLFFIV